VRALPYGDAAILFEAEPPEIRTLAAVLGQRPPGGAIDIVPAERTVLVRVAPGTDLGLVRAYGLALQTSASDPSGADEPGQPETVSIPVTYDGADLDRVAELTGLGPVGVVDAHTSTPWTVAFCGFAPGFAYLTGGDPRLAVPRRDSPRAHVPAGSVALAGSYSAVYPGDSPGGWQLIGRTAATVWDLDSDPPARLRLGVRVTFTDVTPAP
jgi:KipI family sensor histidine kinase inhibitor